MAENEFAPVTLAVGISLNGVTGIVNNCWRTTADLRVSLHVCNSPDLQMNLQTLS